MATRHLPLPLALLIAGVLACGPFTAMIPTPTAPWQLPTPTLLPTATAAVPSPTPPPMPTAAPTPLPPPTPTPEHMWLTGEVRLFPGPLHYEGDLLSVEVVVGNLARLPTDRPTTLIVDGKRSIQRLPEPVYHPLLDDYLLYSAVWDTRGEAGLHELTLEIPIDGERTQTLTTFVEILPADQRPPNEKEARWEKHQSACCLFYYLSGTAAARDIAQIAERADVAFARVEGLFGGIEVGLFPVVLIDNVWGNGAYATRDEIVLSYVDRAYAGSDLETVLAHEMVHYVTHALGKETPALLIEGLAVYVAGGHYKPEPIPARASAMLDLGWYIPLADLTDRFRDHQHELAYLEAAGLVAYLVETYGWDSFLSLYTTTLPEGSGSAWLDAALRQVYGPGLDTIEGRYLTWLKMQAPESQIEDLSTTLHYYETVRRYQALYAPYHSLPPIAEAVERSITAPFIREATEPENLALETMLVAAYIALHEGRYLAAQELLDQVNTTFDTGDFTRQPVGDYLAVAQLLAKSGYEVQRITLLEDTAIVWAIQAQSWPTLEMLTLLRSSDGWMVDNSN